MYVMKKYFILGIILFSGLTCSAAVYLGTRIPVVGQTISDKKVQGSIVSYVYAKVSRENRRCRDLQLIDTKVTAQPTNVKFSKYGKQVSGNWKEEWTVDACGQKMVVPIDFELSRSGTRYIINNAQKVK